jgi:hypothetical protein
MNHIVFFCNRDFGTTLVGLSLFPCTEGILVREKNTDQTCGEVTKTSVRFAYMKKAPHIQL